MATKQIVNGYVTPDVYTTSTGEKVKFIGLNQQRIETLRNAGKLPPVPKREVPNDIPGEKSQWEELSADDLQDEAEKAEWEDYTTKKNAIELRREENVVKYMFTSGFEVLNLTDEKLDEWKAEEVEVWGNELPTNRVDLLLAYINTRVIGNADDYSEIMAGVMERTGVPAEMLDDIRNSFRNSIRQSAAGKSDAEEGTPE